MGQSRGSDPIPLPESAFAELLERTQRQIYRFMYSLLGSQEEARDGVQDVYVAAWRAAQSHDPPFTLENPDPVAREEAMRRWLFRVAYRRAAAILRHRRLITWQSLDAEQPADALEDSTGAGGHIPFEDRIADGEEMHALLAGLEPEDAACLILKFVQGYTAVEMAQILGITPEAARKRLSRALPRLRAAYFAREASGGQPAHATGMQRTPERTPERKRAGI